MSRGYWNVNASSVNFSRNARTPSVHLDLFCSSHKSAVITPSYGLELYELGDGIHIAQCPWNPQSAHTLIKPGQAPTVANLGFVEACINPNLNTLTLDAARKGGVRLARLKQLSPETHEVFDVHIASFKGMLADNQRAAKIARMKSIIKDLGDMSEDEVLELWREARAEEVMDA